jgi:hypothetical protein
VPAFAFIHQCGSSHFSRNSDAVWGRQIALKKYQARVLIAFASAFVLTAPSEGWAASIALSNTYGLVFGRFVAGSGGTVTVSPAGGRSASGGVVLMPSGPGAAAQFAVSGDTNLTYAISLPGNGIVSLTSGSNAMAVNSFVSTPALTGQLSIGGSQSLMVGATLSVGSNQAPGTYSGVFDATVNYN